MQIILSILQFIGIALLVLLGILLVLMLLILCYPICYTIEGELYREKNAKAKVSWLFHLIRANVVYQDDIISAKIGIFWKNIPFSYELKTKEEKESETLTDEAGWLDKADWENAKDVSEEDVLWEESDTDADNISKMQNETEVSIDSQQDSVDMENICEGQKSDSSHVLKDTSKNANRKETSKFHKKRIKKNKTKTENASSSITSDEKKISFIEKMKGMISKIKGTINKIKQVWDKIKAIIMDERNKSAIAHIKKESTSLLKSFLPKKSKIDGVFSLGSPDKTGKAFGILCAFPFIYQNEWSVSPDFVTETAYFEGRFYAKGRIYLYKIVGMALSILLNKNCRRLYSVIKQFINSLKALDS